MNALNKKFLETKHTIESMSDCHCSCSSTCSNLTDLRAVSEGAGAALAKGTTVADMAK